MGVLEFLHDLDIVELDIKVLVNTLQDTTELDIVLEFDRDLVVDEGLKKAVLCLVRNSHQDEVQTGGDLLKPSSS